MTSSDLEFSTPERYNVATYPPGATFGPRHLRDWEFVWLIEGRATYHRDGVDYAAPEGSIVLCRPGATDGFTWDAQRRTRHGFFHFNIVRTPASWPAQDLWPVVRLAESNQLLRILFNHILTWDTHSDLTQKRSATALFLSAFVTGSAGVQSPAHEAWPEPVERAWALIMERVEDAGSVALDDLASAACVSPEHLCRLFGRATGHAPMETLRLARLDRAAQLLARSNFPVGEIARLCGFASAFHFSRSFRAAFHMSPREVRAAVRAGQTPPLTPLLETRIT